MHYAIGDIHANLPELEKLLKILQPHSDDTLIFLGDYVDCLPQARETIVLLSELEKKHSCIFLKGNHEFLWECYLEGDLNRQEYLLRYGGIDTVRSFGGEEAIRAFHANDLSMLRLKLAPLLQRINHTKDWHLADEYLLLHAGLLPEQYATKELRFEESNFFLRTRDILPHKKYLDRYTLVAGHTSPGTEPLFAPGYINIDLGARQKGFLAAFALEEGVVIRSDGSRFPRP